MKNRAVLLWGSTIFVLAGSHRYVRPVRARQAVFLNLAKRLTYIRQQIIYMFCTY